MEFSTLSTELSTENGPETPVFHGFQNFAVDNFCEDSTYPQRFAQFYRFCPQIFRAFFHEKCENNVWNSLRNCNIMILDSMKMHTENHSAH